MLVGPNGVGKTMCACNIGYQAVLAGHTAPFTTAGQLLGELAALDSYSAGRLRREGHKTGFLLQVPDLMPGMAHVYLSACMGLYNGGIVAYRMARRPVFELVSSTLEAAFSRTRCAAELIVHSDQGWHYKMQPYRAMLARRGVKQSMSRKGNCFDSAVIESFFGTLNLLAAPNSLDALEAGVHDYVHYYNHERIKLGLQGLSPEEYRLRSTA